MKKLILMFIMLTTPAIGSDIPLVYTITMAPNLGYYFISLNCEAAGPSFRASDLSSNLKDIQLVLDKKELSCNYKTYSGKGKGKGKTTTWVGIFKGTTQAACCLNNMRGMLDIIENKGFKPMPK